MSQDEYSVSIHAPVKGATCLARKHCVLDSVSIHAPVKGATQVTQHKQGGKKCFNPRTRKGCDYMWHADDTTLMWFQSTHP